MGQQISSIENLMTLIIAIFLKTERLQWSCGKAEKLRINFFERGSCSKTCYCEFHYYLYSPLDFEAC